MDAKRRIQRLDDFTRQIEVANEDVAQLDYQVRLRLAFLGGLGLDTRSPKLRAAIRAQLEERVGTV